MKRYLLIISLGIIVPVLAVGTYLVIVAVGKVSNAQDRVGKMPLEKFVDAVDNQGKWKNKEFQVLAHFENNGFPLSQLAQYNNGKLEGGLQFSGNGTNTKLVVSVNMKISDAPKVMDGDQVLLTLHSDEKGQYKIVKIERP